MVVLILIFHSFGPKNIFFKEKKGPKNENYYIYNVILAGPENRSFIKVVAGKKMTY